MEIFQGFLVLLVGAVGLTAIARRIKVGSTDRSAAERVAEQAGTNTPEAPVLLARWPSPPGMPAVAFERALMVQAAASKLRRYRSIISSSHGSSADRPNKSHPWACRQIPDESEP